MEMKYVRCSIIASMHDSYCGFMNQLLDQQSSKTDNCALHEQVSLVVMHYIVIYHSVLFGENIK